MATDDQLRHAMSSAMQSFAAVVASIKPQQWDLPSPCDGWSVFDVVEHVVAGEHFTTAVLSGSRLEDAVAAAEVGLDPETDDRVAALTAAAAIALAAFDGSLDRTIEHRVGTISARRMLGFRIIDELGHTWDIATAIGQPFQRNPEVLAVGLELALAELPTLQASANFATGHDGRPESGDPLDTFLWAIGRSVDA